jgi:hypothetical protein
VTRTGTVVFGKVAIVKPYWHFENGVGQFSLRRIDMVIFVFVLKSCSRYICRTAVEVTCG